uniref:Uncharacterized protein n=1 Tax=Amphimedon queenslandica TaxID=400682 RepID=A0A1X7UE06_AMPQE
MADEIKRLPAEEREELMKAADFTITVPAEQGLALKSDLCLHWRKVRIMRRWMKSWGLSIASEQKQRRALKTMLMEMEIQGESIPFSFRTRSGGQELRLAPFAFVNNLKSTLFHLLEEKQSVERQAYYGDTFIGNHVHKALKPANIKALCKSVVDTATTHDLSLVPKVQQLLATFIEAFTLFSKCHKLYDSGRLDEIDLLGHHIDKFMEFYRAKCPEASCIPKMHMLEKHVVSWLKQWRVSCGYMGEQGAEALHANFNTCARAYNNMRDRVERLKVVLHNHHMQVLPSTASFEPPPIKKRKKKALDTA